MFLTTLQANEILSQCNLPDKELFEHLICSLVIDWWNIGRDRKSYLFGSIGECYYSNWGVPYKVNKQDTWLQFNDEREKICKIVRKRFKNAVNMCIQAQFESEFY